MKYKIKEDVWQDKVTGQNYKKDYAFRPIVSFDENGKTIKGYVYSPTDLAEDFLLDVENTDYQARCFTQKLFLTDEQVATRFQYLGEIEREEDINASIRHYEQEECNFENKEWLANLTLRGLKNEGGLAQCVHAKLFEFFLENALPESDKKTILKIQYYNSENSEEA